MMLSLIKNVLSTLVWPAFILTKVVLIVVGVVVVLPLHWLIDPKPVVGKGIYRVEPGRPQTYWEAFIRNPVAGFRVPDEFLYYQWGEVLEATQTKARFQWRFRRSSWKSSLRLLWQYGGEHYGEMYLGFKIASSKFNEDGVRFGLSLRPWAKVGN